MTARYAHFYVTAGVLALAPLPFGSNRPLSWTLVILLLGLLAAVWPLVPARRGLAPALPLAPLLPAGILIAGALAWAAAQMWQGAPPEWSHPLWAVAAQHGVPGADFISASPYSTGTGLMRLVGYTLAFWLVVSHALSRRRAGRLVDILAATGGLYALYGLVAHMSGSETILWYRKWAYEGYLTSTFVNRNSYAAFAGLSLLCALTAVLRRLQGERLHPTVLLRHLHRRTALFALATLLIVMSALESGSRAGVLSALCALLVFAAALAATRSGAAHPLAVLGLAAVCAVMLAVWGGMVGLSKTMIEFGSDRLQVYELVLSAIAERPWLGHGLGSFPHLMQEFRTTAQNTVWIEVHNTYLELAFELGVPAAAALLAGVLWLTVRLLLGLGRRRDGHLFIALGLAATLQVALHSTVDFVAQIPAVAVLWVALLGLGIARAEVDRSHAGNGEAA